MCGMLVFSISFSLLGEFVPQEEKLKILKHAGPASTGLTFIWIPLLYSKIEVGRFIAVRSFLPHQPA
jgi:NSS family neurotransmitter:Na+ symporter